MKYIVLELFELSYQIWEGIKLFGLLLNFLGLLVNLGKLIFYYSFH